MTHQSMTTLMASPTMARVFANDASLKVRVPAILLISSLQFEPVKSLTLLPKKIHNPSHGEGCHEDTWDVVRIHMVIRQVNMFPFFLSLLIDDPVLSCKRENPKSLAQV
jgi:hypothetical protein